MMHDLFATPTIAGAALVAVGLSAAPVQDDGAAASSATGPFELRFEPPTESALAMTITEGHDLLLRDLTTRVGDQDPVSAEGAFRFRTRVETAFVDEYAATLGPVRRRYVDAATTLQAVDPESVDEETGEWTGQEFKLSSPFRDVSVAFVPSEGQPDGYARHYDGRALREPMLPLLSAPIDWSIFLPPTDSSGVRRAGVGDSWALDIAALEALVGGAGFLRWQGEAKEEEPSDERLERAFAAGVGGNLHMAFDGVAEGEVRASVARSGGDGPDRWLDIELVLDVRLRADRSDFVDDRRLESIGEDAVDMLGANLAVFLVGTATLRWNLAEQRPESAALDAEETVVMNVRLQPSGGVYFEQAMAMEGSLTSRIGFDLVPRAPVRRTEGR